MHHCTRCAYSQGELAVCMTLLMEVGGGWGRYWSGKKNNYGFICISIVLHKYLAFFARFQLALLLLPLNTRKILLNMRNYYLQK
jgi:hypothetical protein